MNALPLAVLLFAQGPGAGGPRALPDPFSREGICAFAGHLDAEGDAADAAAEYARCLFLSEAADSSLHPELRRRRIQALLRAGAPDPAYREFRAWARADTGEPLRETAYALGKELVRADRDSLVPPLLAGLSAPRAPDSLQARLRLLEASAWLRMGRGDSARAALALASREGGKGEDASIALLSGLAGESRNGTGRRWLAGLLSACVPGLGKVYAGRPVDGGATLLVMAFLGWQAWDGYAHDGPASVKGAIFAASTAGLYAGNVYGSMRAVDVENEKRRKAYAERIKFAVAFRLP